MSISNSSRDLLHSAETCVNNGEIDKAQSLIEQAISIKPIEKSIFADAVNILLDAALYNCARNLFEIYQKETGMKLVTDFTYEEILHMEEESCSVKVTEKPILFRRMSLRERGHFSNIFALRPVKEIEISGTGFSITQGGKISKFAWTEVSSAHIVMKDRYKSYGTGTAAKFIQKIFILNVSSKTFKFDVSANFPDFKNNDQLLNLLQKYLHVEVVDERKRH